MLSNKNKIMMYKQTGATLFTSLVFLILITIVGVSAAKISMLDVMVAGNNEQQMRLFQVAENDLKELATIQKLFPPLAKQTGHAFNATTGIYVPTASTHADYKILDSGLDYSCDGFSGKLTSQGGANQRSCALFDFQVDAKADSAGITDRHNRGAGKELPRLGSSFSTLN